MVMTAVERTLLATLLDLETAIRDRASAQAKPDFKSWFARLDGLANQLPSTDHPMLLHYLRQRSYEKARLYLQKESARCVPQT